MNTNSQTVARFVTVTMAAAIGLTFMFGFGNVLNSLNLVTFYARLAAPWKLTYRPAGHSESAWKAARRIAL